MAAMDLKIPNICELCSNFIQDMDLEQALIIILTKNIPLSNPVFRMAFQFVENNFSKVSEHELYMKIEINVLSRLLSSDDLNIRWELEVLDNLLKWTYYSFKNRKIHFTSLVKHVRFTQMTVQELRYACTMAKLFRESSVCESVVAESVRQRYQLLEGDINHTSENPRNCFKTAEENTTTGANNCLTSSYLESNSQSKPSILQISGGESCVTNAKSDLVPNLNSEVICNYNRNCQFSPNVFNNIQSFMGNSMNVRSCENISSVQLNKRDGTPQTQSKIESNLNKSSFNQFKKILDESNQLITSTTEFKSDLTKQKAVTHNNTAHINAESVSLGKKSNAIDLSSGIYNLFDCTTKINPLRVDKESKLFPLDNASKIKTICGQTTNSRIKQQSKMHLFIKSNRLRVNNKISKILHKRTSGVSCMFVRRKKPTITKTSYLTLKSKTDVENGFINNKKHFPSALHILSKNKMCTCRNNDTATVRRYDRVKHIEGGFSNYVFSNSEAGSGTELENNENSNNENNIPIDKTGVKLDHISQPVEQEGDRVTHQDDIENEDTQITPGTPGPLILITNSDGKPDEKKTLPDYHKRITYGTNISIRTAEPLLSGANVTSAYIWENSSISRPVIMMKNTDFNYNLPNVCSVLLTTENVTPPLPTLTTFLTQRRNSIDICTDLIRFARKRAMPKKCFSDEVLSVWETELRRGIAEAAEKYKHNSLFNKSQKLRMVSPIAEVDSSSDTRVTLNDDKNNSQNTKGKEVKPSSSKKSIFILEASAEPCLDNVPDVDYYKENDVETNEEEDNQKKEDNYDSAKDETASIDVLSMKAVATCSCTSVPSMDWYKPYQGAPYGCIHEEPILASTFHREPTKPQKIFATEEKDNVEYVGFGSNTENCRTCKRLKTASTSPSKKNDQAQQSRQPREINMNLTKQEQDTLNNLLACSKLERCKICNNFKLVPISPPPSQAQETRQPQEIDIDLAKQEQDTMKYVVAGNKMERCKICKRFKFVSTSAPPKETNEPQKMRQPEESDVDFAKQEQDTAEYVVLGRKLERCKRCKKFKVISTPAPPEETSESQENRQPGEVDIDLTKQEQDTAEYVVIGGKLERCKKCKNFKVDSRPASLEEISEPQENREPGEVDIDLTKQEQDTAEYVVIGGKMKRCKKCKDFKVVSKPAAPEETSEPQENRQPGEVDIDLTKQEQDTPEYVVIGGKLERCKKCKKFKVDSKPAQPEEIGESQENRQPGEVDIDLTNQEQDTAEYVVIGGKMEKCKRCKTYKIAPASAPPEEISEPQENKQPGEIDIDLAKQGQDTVKYVVVGNKMERCKVCKRFKVAPTSASLKEPQDAREPGENDTDQEQDTAEYVVIGGKMERCMRCKNFKVVSIPAPRKETSESQEAKQLEDTDTDLDKQDQQNAKYVVAGNNPESCNVCRALVPFSSFAPSKRTYEPQEINIDLSKQEQETDEYEVSDNAGEICDKCHHLKSLPAPAASTQPEGINIDLADQAEGSTKYVLTNDKEYVDVNAASTSKTDKEVYQLQDFNVHFVEPKPACDYCFVDDIIDVSNSFLTFQQPCCHCNRPHCFESEFTQIFDEHIVQPCCAHVVTRNLASICECNLSCCSSTSSMEDFDFLFTNHAGNFDLKFTNIN